MGKDNVIGLAMNLDVSDLKSGIKKVKSMMKESEQAFKVATAGMDKWTENTDGLNAKLSELNSKLSLQKKTVKGYEAEIKRVSAMEGDHAEELKNLTEKLQSAEIAVKKTEKNIKRYSETLQTVIDKEKESEKAFNQLTNEISEQEEALEKLKKEYQNSILQFGKNSKETKSLGKNIKNLSKDLEKNKSKVDGTKNALQKIEKQFEKTADGAEDFAKGLEGIKKLSGGVVGGVKTFVGTVGALSGAFLATASGTKEYRTNLGKLQTGFEEAGHSADSAKKTYQDLYSIVADEGKATEASAHLALLTNNQKELSNWTNILTGVYATFGDSLPIENLAEAANETIKTGKITGGLADSLNWAGISETGFQKALDKTTTEQERQKLITETLNKVYGDVGKTYKDVNKDVIESNKSNVEFTDTLAKIGEKSEPILTSIKNGFNKLLQKVLELVNKVDFTKIEKAIDKGFTYFIEEIIPKIIDGFKWIIDNKDILIAGITGLGVALLTLNVVKMVQGMVKAFQAWAITQKGLTAGQIALNIAMMANPIGIVISAVAGLVAGFILLWKNCEGFREFWINLWEKIKEIGLSVWEHLKTAWNVVTTWFSEAVSGIVNIFKKSVEKVKEGWNKLISWFGNIGNKIKSGFEFALNSVRNFFANALQKVKDIWKNVGGWFADIAYKIVNKFLSIPEQIRKLFNNALTFVKNIWKNPGKFFTDVVSKIVKTFTSMPDKLYNIGIDMVEGLGNGIKDMSAWIKSKIKDFTEKSLNAIKEFFGIQSPSKETAEVGRNIVEGMEVGMTEEERNLLKASKKIVNDSLDEMETESDKAFKVGEKIGENISEGIEEGVSETNVDDFYKNLANADKVEISPQIESMSKDDLKKHFANLAKEEDSEPEKKEIEIIVNEPKKITFFDKLENALGISQEKLENWSTSIVGKTFNQAVNYAEQAIDKIGEFVNNMSELFSQLAENEINSLDKELEKFNSAKDEENKKVEENFNNEIESQKELLKNGIITAEEYTNKKTELETNLKNKQKQIEDEKLAKEEEILQKKDKIAKKQFEAQKATNIAMTIVNGTLAIAKGFAELGPIGGAINAGIQTALTAAQCAVIGSQQYVPMLAKGGIVDSPTYAMIGEAGKEVVMPLENNTQWITELANKIYNVMNKDFLSGVNNGNNVNNLQTNNVTNVYNTYNQTINAPKSPSRIELYRDTKNLLSLKGV